jgi:peptide/nickel transport system permease protein
VSVSPAIGLAQEAGDSDLPASRWLRWRRVPIGAWFAGAWILQIIVLAVTANWLPIPGYDVIVGKPLQTPGFRITNPLGTDALGRSELSRLIYGARASLTVAVISALIGMTIGSLLGMTAGYVKGRMDGAVSLITDSILSVPALVLLIAIASIRGAKGSNYVILITGLVVISIPTFARIARAQTLSHTGRDYIVAARALGMSRVRVMFSEVLPNIALPILSYALVTVAILIVVEGSLSFLGIGIPPPSPSWGGMVSDGTQDLTTSPALVVTPSLVIAFTILAFNVLGDHARRVFDTGSGRG